MRAPMALRTLYQTLLDSDTARLRIIAHLWDIQLTTTRRPDMAAELTEAMASSEAVTAAVESLSETERAALDDVLRHGGALPWAVYQRRSGVVRTVGAGRAEREELWRDPASAAEVLWFRGLVQRAFADQDGQAVEMAFIPEDLRLYLPTPPEREVPAPTPSDPPETITKGTDALVDDLVSLWATLQRPDAEGVPTPTPLESIAADRLQLIKTLSAEMSWIKADENDRWRPNPKTVIDWLQADLWTQWSTLADAWVVSEGWNDVAHVPTLRPDPVNPWPGDARGTREAFLNALTHCEPRTWYSVATIRTYIKTYATDFLRRDGIYDAWAPRHARTQAPLRGFDAWDDVEGQLLDYLITGPLTWLGMVDTGSTTQADPGDAVTTGSKTFRLSDAGAAILDLAPPPEVPAPQPVRLVAGAEALVPRRRRYERFQMSRIADDVPTRADQPSGVYRYRFSPSSIQRAKQQRIPVGRIITFLKEATERTELPSSLEMALQRAYRGEGRARLAHPWILRVTTPEPLQLPELAPLIIAHLTPQLVVIREADRLRVQQILVEKGYLTDVDES